MTKHDVLCQVWQFIYYVEERMAAPKLFDKGMMLLKLEQVKEVLKQADGITEKSDMCPQPEGRGTASTKNKTVARETKRRTR